MAAGTIRLVSGTAAGTPPAGCIHIYSKADKKLYYKDDTGTEYELGTVQDASTIEVEYITLDATAIANKQITLAYTPLNPTEVTLDIISGPSQVYSVDYTVTGNILSWSGLPPEAFLEVGDSCRVTYSYNPP
jgi:hypothetical protein